MVRKQKVSTWNNVDREWKLTALGKTFYSLHSMFSDNCSRIFLQMGGPSSKFYCCGFGIYFLRVEGNRLQGALGLYNSLSHSTSVDEDSYKSDCFAIGIDVEKLPMVMASGENLSAGSTVFLKVKGMGSTTSDVPRRATICAHFEKVTPIQDTVVEVFE